MDSNIIDDILRELDAEEQETALAFVRILQKAHLTFHRDTSPYWKDKIYYWVQSGEDCVCFIAIKDPDEKENHWTIWSDDMAFDGHFCTLVDESVRDMAWRFVDFCGQCGSCGGGRHKVIFGKDFDGVCGCTFRIDNPGADTLPFLEAMVSLRLCELKELGNT